MNLRKVFRFLASMQFALILLGILVIACIFGSIIPQAVPAEGFEAAYPKTHFWIETFTLYDVFHCWWFVLLTAALCINLLLCNLIHFPSLMKQMHAKSAVPTENGISFQGDPQLLLKDLGFRKVTAQNNGFYGIRNEIGIWGAWLTHLGILIIIVGFALGQMLSIKDYVYGVPGDVQPLWDSPYDLRIDDFQIRLRPDETVEQYLAKLTLINRETGESWSGESSVNHPLDLQGMRFYQNSTGWAADIVVFKDGQVIEHETRTVGNLLFLKDNPNLAIMLYSLYPDFIRDADGQPATRSGRLNNPAYLYVLYYQQELLGMNVLQQNEKISVGDYEIIFTNPQPYTLIQVKRDPFTGIAGIGGIVLMAALFIAFYLPKEEVWAVPEESGWQIYGKSRKGGPLLRQRMENTAAKLEKR